jgi:hypothetical protein
MVLWLGVEVGRCCCNADQGGRVPPDLDALLTALYVFVDDLLPKRYGPGRRGRISSSELVTLAVAQVLLDCPSERRFLRFAKRRLGHLFPYMPGQSGYNKRLRGLAGEVCFALNVLARSSPSLCDRLRLLDSTPVPCGQSRETVKRSQLAGYAAYGYCAAHSRYFWGFRLYLLCAPDGMPITFCLAPANEPEREVCELLLERGLQGGELVIGDKGLAGREFEQHVTSLGATFLRPDRADEQPRIGPLAGLRQWIESVIDTLKGQLSLEHHGGRTPQGVFVRVAQRLLALAAAIWHNHQHGQPSRNLTAYDH